MGYEKDKDVLVALLKDKKDEYFASVEHWYRIPVSSKKPSAIINNDKLKTLAFYLPKAFGDLKWSVQWFAEVKSIKVVKGKDLIYKTGELKAEKDYYKIEFDKLEELPQPIYSRRGRWFNFITTTEKHLKYARELNDLYYISPLEETMWGEFKKKKMQVERQFEVKLGNEKFSLDFALFCQSGKIDVECDGDTYHMDKKDVEKDKDRDTLLVSKGWKTMRFTTTKIYENLNQSFGRVMEAVNNYGGIEVLGDRTTYKYITQGREEQPRLFDD